MRIPTGVLTDRVAVTRRVQTGAGVQDTVVAAAVPCRISTRLKTTPTSNGVVTMTVTTIYLPATGPNIEFGDHFTLSNGTVVEARDVSAPTVGSHRTHTRVMAW